MRRTLAILDASERRRAREHQVKGAGGGGQTRVTDEQNGVYLYSMFVDSFCDVDVSMR